MVRSCITNAVIPRERRDFSPRLLLARSRRESRDLLWVFLICGMSFGNVVSICRRPGIQLQRLFLPFAFGLFCSASLAAQSPFAPKVAGPLSQRVVAYQIDAKYDPAQHIVDATEILTYRNLTGKPLDRFPFHLYLNAFQPKATWVREAHRDGGFRSSKVDEWDDQDFGSNEVTSFEVVGIGDLTQQMKFISPDDGNPDDKTVFEVRLPRPVASGQDVQFKIKFRAKFPRSLPALRSE